MSDIASPGALAEQWAAASGELGVEPRQPKTSRTFGDHLLEHLDTWWQEHHRHPSGADFARWVNQREGKAYTSAHIRVTLYDLEQAGLASRIARGVWVPVPEGEAQEYVGTHGDGADIRSVRQRVLDARRELQEELGRPPTHVEIGTRAGCPFGSVGSALRDALCKGLLERVEEGVYRDVRQEQDPDR